MKCTKIVATLGPGSNTPDTIEQLLQAGADVIRLNFSHGRHDDHAQSVQRVRDAARKLHRHIAIFQDLQGPKIRLGALEGEFLEVAVGETLRNRESIIAVADAIMMARGDLGVETSPQEAPLMQKALIRQCNITGKPVITATQMLESMILWPGVEPGRPAEPALAIL